MTNLIITESKEKEVNILYLQSTIADVVQSAGCEMKMLEGNDRVSLSVSCSEYFFDLIKAEIVDKIAEIIVVKYKYEFFKKNVLVGGLKSIEREILIASLIAADLEDDKRYTIERIKDLDEIAIDGVFNFRLKPLYKKWQEVAGLIPPSFMPSQLKDFITFLLENKKKRIYIEGGKVYDCHYRRLKRANLLDGDEIKIIREVLLSNCGVIELSGQIPEGDEFYLKEFYSDKIIFS